MKGYNVYSKVHQMREAGFSQRAIAKALGIEYSASDCAPRPLELSIHTGGIEQSRRWR